MSTNGRQPRIHTPNTIHHVMVRGNNRQRIFYGEDFFFHFLKIINESVAKLDYKILAYCLMTNHVHLIIRVNNSPLSDVMQNINFRYARWANKKQNRIGHLFQGRYRSIEVKDEMYLINLCRYVHLNPVSAKMVTHTSDYRWSSHINYITRHHPEWMDCNFIIEAIQNKTSLSYSCFIDQPTEMDAWKPVFSLSESGKIII